MPEPIISVSGLRGVIGTELTPAVVTRYVAAFCCHLPPKVPIVVSRDGRATGAMLADACTATLQAHGHPVLNVGIAATPTVGVVVRTLRAGGAIQISASHNPIAYNGLKLFNADGRVLPENHGRPVTESYLRSQADWKSHDLIASSTRVPDPHGDHEQLVLSIVDQPTIAGRRFRVLLDSNRGAGSLLGHRLLESLGCHVELLGGVPDGAFEHPPEPLAENLTTVSTAVQSGGFHVGFCQDPDADRLAVIDENGNYIGEELTLALCLLRILSQRKGAIVTNCATSSMAEQLARRFDVPFFRSKVGEANVADMMVDQKAIFGGEGNGGPIDPRVGLVRDSFVGMAIILDLMAATGKSISQLVGELPKLAMLKTKLTLDSGRLRQAIEAVRSGMGAPQASEMDGLRLDWPDRWLLVRGSNTEPIARLIAEAPTLADANELCERAGKLIAEA